MGTGTVGLTSIPAANQLTAEALIFCFLVVQIFQAPKNNNYVLLMCLLVKLSKLWTLTNWFDKFYYYICLIVSAYYC